MTIRVIGSLDFDLTVEADTQEEAFEIASDLALKGGGDWSYYCVDADYEED